MRRLLAVWLGKLVFGLSRIMQTGGGQAAPGYYAAKLFPDIWEKVSPDLPQSIVITGTNGKTTTAKMVALILEKQGLKVLRNTTGSNLERGILSTILVNSDWKGSIRKFDVAIWELDEAVVGKVVQKLHPQVVVFLNIFRDQMDRYGEIDSLIKEWKKCVAGLEKEVKVVINGDDRLLAVINGAGSINFGVEGFKIKGEKYVRETETFQVDFEAKKVSISDAGSEFEVGGKLQMLNLPGVYNVYNATAAMCAISAWGMEIENEMLSDFIPAFGRVERIGLGGGRLMWLMLVKNPKGADAVIDMLMTKIQKNDQLLVILNDNFADGTDVSWIWDVGWERLVERVDGVKVAGRRMYDMALRLKYAGWDAKTITVEPKLDTALNMMLDRPGNVYVLPTYTAMLQVQKWLKTHKLKKNYWEN